MLALDYSTTHPIGTRCEVRFGRLVLPGIVVRHVRTHQGTMPVLRVDYPADERSWQPGGPTSGQHWEEVYYPGDRSVIRWK